MTPIQSLVFVVGLLLIGLSVMEYWKPQFSAVIA
jgi:hypothetical protein